jgi:hypothetical protein
VVFAPTDTVNRSVTLTVTKGTQTIGAFAAIGNKTYGVSTFAVTTPTASSRLPVVLSVKSGPAMVSGNMVTVTGVGTVVLAVNQAGNENFNAAAEVTTSFAVAKGASKILTIPYRLGHPHQPRHRLYPPPRWSPLKKPPRGSSPPHL